MRHRRKMCSLVMAMMICIMAPGNLLADIIGDVSLKLSWSSPTGNETIYGSYRNYYLDYDVSINGSNSMEAFCVEGADASKVTEQYTLLTIDSSLSNFGLNPVAYGTAAWIAENYYNTAEQERWKAAAQVAIWEVVFDDLTLNLSAGNLIADAYKNDAQTILDSLPKTSLPDFSNNWVLAVNPTVGPGGTVNKETYQNYLVRVPEASTMLLLGFGLLGIAFFRRQRIFK